MSGADHLRLILVRHGQTEWNLQGRYQGRADPPICPVGFVTAQRAAAALHGRGAALLLASPLQRARQTAAVIARTVGGLQSVVDERLTEIDFGQWQGLTQAQVRVRWPALLRSWKRAPDSVRFPGGERLLDALERLRDFLLNPPWLGCGAQCALAVSHAGVIRLASLLAEERPLAQFREIAVASGALHEFHWYAGGSLRRVACTALSRG